MTLRVLELGGAAAGYAGRLFAHLGAEVVCLSESESDAGVSEGMLAQAQSLYLHGRKKLRRDIGGPLAVAAAAATGDNRPFDIVIVESSAAELASRNWHDLPAKVRVAISPFGLDGPACDWQAAGSVLLAMGGYTALTDDPGRTPLTLPGH